MKDQHKLLFTCDGGRRLLKGLVSGTVKEPPICLELNNRAQGKFHALEIFEGVSGCNCHPQTVADLFSNTYVRLTYQKSDGTSGTFGTSIVGSVSFRTADNVLHFIPKVNRASATGTCDQHVQVVSHGEFPGLALLKSTRTYEQRAEIDKTIAQVKIEFSALEDISLHQPSLGRDAFRLFSISSMFASTACYDANVIQYGSHTLVLNEINQRCSYLLPENQRAGELKVIKVCGSRGAIGTPGSPDSPTISARVIQSSVPIETLVAQAYLHRSTKITDDSLSIWLEWAGCPPVIPKHQTISVLIEFRAEPPQSNSAS